MLRLKIYHIVSYAIILGIRIHALWNAKSQKSLQGRKQRIQLPESKTFRVWVHCASLGEFEQGRPIIDRLKNDFECEIVLTFFSPSGFEVRKAYENADYVFYLPFDTKSHTASFLEKVKPDLCIFVKYEFWWNFIQKILASKIPLLFISTQFRADHYLFKYWAKPFTKLLQRADQLFTADEHSKQLLLNNGFENVTLSGDTRIDSILSRMQQNNPIPKIDAFKGGAKLIIMGSIYPSEFSAVKDVISSCSSEQKLAIFLHEMHHKDLITLQKMAGSKGILYSKFQKENLSKEILIVDNIGMLADAYRYADIVYIGGGFNNGIHNILEPLIYKIPIIFGPGHQRFAEAIQLKNYKGIEEVNHLEEIEMKIFELINLKDRKDLELSSEIMFSSKATERIINYIKQSYPINEKRKD